MKPQLKFDMLLIKQKLLCAVRSWVFLSFRVWSQRCRRAPWWSPDHRELSSEAVQTLNLSFLREAQRPSHFSSCNKLVCLNRFFNMQLKLEKLFKPSETSLIIHHVNVTKLFFLKFYFSLINFSFETISYFQVVFFKDVQHHRDCSFRTWWFRSPADIQSAAALWV